MTHYRIRKKNAYTGRSGKSPKAGIGVSPVCGERGFPYLGDRTGGYLLLSL